jgi:hypothetical protein
MSIFAYTASGVIYPEYISVNETGDPNLFRITVRSAPTKQRGCYICGYAADKGKPGRCTPGDDRCNNYCNMAPEKGRMQDAPQSCEHIREGSVATITLTKEHMQEIAAAIIGPPNN